MSTQHLRITSWRRALAGLALAGAGAVAAAGLYTEARRAPDQP
jgi:hypothetical protein